MGLTWCQEHRPELSGVVTVDCDGQHSLEDVEKVLAAMDRNPGSLILGCRSFGEGDSGTKPDRKPDDFSCDADFLWCISWKIRRDGAPRFQHPGFRGCCLFPVNGTNMS